MFHESFSAKLQKIHKINGFIPILSENFKVQFVSQRSKKSAKKHSPYGRAAFAHLLRFPAQLDFSSVYIYFGESSGACSTQVQLRA
jgi:hypothetical protein